jgi:hypothetical protein
MKSMSRTVTFFNIATFSFSVKSLKTKNEKQLLHLLTTKFLLHGNPSSVNRKIKKVSPYLLLLSAN